MVGKETVPQRDVTVPGFLILILVFTYPDSLPAFLLYIFIAHCILPFFLSLPSLRAISLEGRKIGRLVYILDS